MRRILMAVAVAAALFAGCGDDDESGAPTPAPAQEETAPAGDGGQELALAAVEDGSLEFDKTELSAPAGSVTVTFSNPSQVPHALAIEGNGIEEATETVTGSGAPPITVDLEAGEYTFYCPVGGHRAAGMEGTLTVG